MTKDWNGNGKSTFITIGASNHTDKEREAHDFYATDPVAIDSLSAASSCRRRFGSVPAVRAACRSDSPS